MCPKYRTSYCFINFSDLWATLVQHWIWIYEFSWEGPCSICYDLMNFSNLWNWPTSNIYTLFVIKLKLPNIYNIYICANQPNILLISKIWRHTLQKNTISDGWDWILNFKLSVSDILILKGIDYIEKWSWKWKLNIRTIVKSESENNILLKGKSTSSLQLLSWL